MFKRSIFSSAQGLQALRLGLATAVAVSAMALSPLAQAAKAKPNEAKASEAKPANLTPGMRVVKDPATGELRAPTAAEAAELDLQDAKAKAALSVGKRKAASVAQAPQEIVHPDGTVEMPLDETSNMYSVAVRRADGSIGFECVNGKEAADSIIKGKKPASSKAVKANQEHGHAHK